MLLDLRRSFLITEAASLWIVIVVSFSFWPISRAQVAIGETSIAKRDDSWRAPGKKTDVSTFTGKNFPPKTTASLKPWPAVKPTQPGTGALGAPTPGTLRIALDVGHTARSGGAVSASGVMEYQFNKEAVKTIASQVAMLPSVEAIVVDWSGAPISLPERASRANAAGAGLFLAVHHDSANDRYLLPVKIGERRYRQTTRFHGYSVFYSAKNRYSGESLRFARTLGAAMRRQGLTPTLHHAEHIPGENREVIDPELGVYRFDDLVVLKRANMPAALLECGVIVNPEEEQELRQPARRLMTARAVAEAVSDIAPSLKDKERSDDEPAAAQ